MMEKRNMTNEERGSLANSLIISLESGMRGLSTYPGIPEDERPAVIRSAVARGLKKNPEDPECPLCGHTPQGAG